MTHKERLAEIEKRTERVKFITSDKLGLSHEGVMGLVDNTDYLLSRVKTLTEALEFYADKDNWKDVWKENNKESPDFKYFYMLRQRTKDFEKLAEPYHYYAGLRARKALEESE